MDAIHGTKIFYLSHWKDVINCDGGEQDSQWRWVWAEIRSSVFDTLSRHS